MANVVVNGFRPWGTVTGGQGVLPHPLVQEVANNYNTALGIGDIIIPVSDGTVARGAASNDGLLLGVIIGMSKVVSGKRQPTNYVAANTTFTPTTVGSANATLVEYLPLTADLILEVCGDDATTATTTAAQIALIGENADLATGTADSTTGVSGFLLDISTHATTAANFRILPFNRYVLEDGYSRTATDVDPAATGYPFLVVCNESFWPSYTTTGA